VIAIDTNLLVYAHRRDAAGHQAARDALASLARSGRRWAVPWPCVHEFLAIVTHPRIYRPPTESSVGLTAMADLQRLSHVMFLAETSDHPDILGRLLGSDRVIGAKVHDARVTAICIGHGVDVLWTADRDFSYFPELRTHNPLAT